MKSSLLTNTIFISLSMVSFTALAQTFQINGQVKDLNDSVVYGTVRLMDSKANLLKGTITDNKGTFELNNIEKSNYLLIISSVGFQPDTTVIKELSKNLDIGVIYLQPAITNLGEVKISAKSVFSKEGIKYVVPPSNIVKSSTNGIMLLYKMNLSRLRIDPLANTVKVSGGGEVQFRINGREVSVQEISTLQPDEIIRIEYHDKPEARFNYAAVVLNYIVKHETSGGYINTEIWTGLLNSFGENGVVAKMNHKRSEFSGSYFIAYRNWNHLWRENHETFNLQDQTITRYEDGKPSDFEYYNHRARLSYNFQDTNKLFNVSLRTRINNFVHKDWKSNLYSNASSAPVGMLDRSQHKLFHPSLSIYYQHSLNKKETLIFNLFGMDNSGIYKRYYQESYKDNLLTDLYSNVEEEQYIGGMSFLYENKMKLGALNLGLQQRSSLTRNTYYNVSHSLSSSNISTLELHNLYLYAQFGRQINKWYYRVGVGANINFQNIENKSNNYINFRPSLVLTYTLNEDLEFSYTGSAFPTMPSLSALSDYDQKIDALQIIRGNPLLKPQTNYYNAIAVEYNKNKLGFSYFLNHTYTSSPLMENTYLENNLVVRSMKNHERFQKLNTEVYFRTKLFNEILSVGGYTGIKYYVSNGNSYDHTKSIFYYGCDINISYKNFTLMWLLNQNTYDSFWGETLSRDESAHVVSLSYNTSNFYIGIDCFNMFSTKHIASRENYSYIAPFTRYEYLSEVKNLLRIKLTYTFRYGKEYNAQSRKIRNPEDAESGILKGEK